MAKQSTQAPLKIPSAPQWETRAKRPFTDGRWQGIDNSLWLWRVAPMGSVTDARSEEDMINVGRPLSIAYSEMARLAGRGRNRRQAKALYRETHALLVNVPRMYRAPHDHKLRDYLNRGYGDKIVLDRFLLFGVKLRDNPAGRGWRSAIESAAETLRYGGAPLEDYDGDAEIVSNALSRAGFSVPTMPQMHLADSWWNFGASPGIPVLPHEEHIHFFRTVQSARRSEKADRLDCTSWPDQDAEFAISFATVQDFDLRYTEATDHVARWVTPLLDRNARVISIRAKVEPSTITREELRGQIRRYREDLEEMQAQNKMDRAEMKERFDELGKVEVAYSSGSAAPTLTETSVIVGFDGTVRDIAEYEPSGITLSSMVNRQAAAWHETMVCSSVRANPYVHDLPSSTVAFSSLPGISRVGDKGGALLGYTERDRQAAYFDPRIASTEESTSPLTAVLGASGSGKTIFLQFLADQIHRLGIPQLIVNPKAGDSMRDALVPAGARLVTLDSIVTSDGILDPLRIFVGDEETAISKAVSMIAMVNPYGDRASAYLTDLAYAIKEGVALGGQATGHALKLAYQAGKVRREVVEPVFRYAQVYPMFAATFGMEPQGETLQLSDGMTLIEVGQMAFELPPQSFQGDVSTIKDPTVRNSMNVIRMLLWGGMSALRHRQGAAVHFDESWVVEMSAPGDLDQIGRLSRSWDILPVLYTQKPSLQVSAGLRGYFSRGFIGHIKDPAERDAALEIFGQEKNDEMRRRITQGRHLSGDSGANYDSLQHLASPDGGAPTRGSVFYHVDIRGRVAPVEVSLNEEFLSLARTDPDEVRRRRLAHHPRAA